LKVLIITSLFLPDVAANAKRMNDLASELVSGGHQVTVLSAVPHYPHGRIQPEWRRRPFRVTRENGMKVVRVWVYASPGRKIWQKALNYLSFLGSSLPAAAIVGLDFDVILTISPPLLSGLSAFYYSRLSRKPFIFDVQDLYPETAVQLGVLKGRRIIAFFETLEKFIYRKSAHVTVISDGFRRSLLGKGVPEDKVTVMPNWADIKTFSPSVTPVDKDEIGLGERFIVMFLGTIGRAQGCEVIIEAAARLREREDIGFCLLGDGVARQQLEDKVLRLKLENVSFLDPVPHQEVPRYLSAADACLVHLVANELYKITLPSKMYEYMAMGKPILMGVEGEAARLIEESGAGLNFKPQDSQHLADAVTRLAADPQLCAESGDRGRKYCVEHYSRVGVLDKYEQLLKDVTPPSSEP